jgi:hypothetical protein
MKLNLKLLLSAMEGKILSLMRVWAVPLQRAYWPLEASVRDVAYCGSARVGSLRNCGRGTDREVRLVEVRRRVLRRVRVRRVRKRRRRRVRVGLLLDVRRVRRRARRQALRRVRRRRRRWLRSGPRRSALHRLQVALRSIHHLTLLKSALDFRLCRQCKPKQSFSD